MILERLREKGVPIDTTGRNMPSAYAVVECGAITETGRNRRQRDIDANLTLVFCTSDRDAEQRDMIRAVLQQAVDALADQSLGLPMEPMAFAGIENITSERGSQSGLSVYQLRFMTRHDVT